MLQLEESQPNNENFLFPLRRAESAFLFKIPKDYFKQFPQEMLAVIHAIKASDPTLSIDKINPFHLPENYFDQFASLLLNKIKEEEATLRFINDLPRTNPFQLPQNYFNELGDNIIGHIFHQERISAEEEIRTIAPLLSGLRDKKVFEVPKDYFEIRKKTVPIKTAAARSIQWARWTAAAAILLIFGLGGFQLFNTDTPIEPQFSFQQALNQVPDAEIQAYLEKTIDSYEFSSLTEAYAQNGQQPKNDILNGVTDQEIEAYLNSSVNN